MPRKAKTATTPETNSMDTAAAALDSVLKDIPTDDNLFIDHTNLKPVPPPSKSKRALAAEKFRSKFNADHPSARIMVADEIAQPQIVRIPSGIAPLDVDLGGGAPCGRITVINGGDNGGKSTLLYMFFAMLQRIYGDACVLGLASPEGTPDYMYMRQCGVIVSVPQKVIDTKNEALVKSGRPPMSPDKVRELKRQVGTFHIIGGTDCTGEETLQSILEATQANCYHAIGIDSLTVIQPDEEVKKDMEDNMKKATHASLVTRFNNKWHQIVKNATVKDTNYTALIIIEQMRANQDKGMYNPAEKKPAPTWSGRHASSLTINLNGESKERSTKAADRGRIIGKKWKWEVGKGKDGVRDGKSGELVIYHNDLDSGKTPFNIYEILVETAKYYGILREHAQGNDSSYDAYRADKEAMCLGIPSYAQLVEKMMSNVDFELAIRKEIFLAANANNPNAEDKIITYTIPE